MCLYKCVWIYTFSKNQKKTTECCRMIELFFLFFYMLISDKCHKTSWCARNWNPATSTYSFRFRKKKRLKRGRACWRAACAKGFPRTHQTPHFVKSESWRRKVIEQRSNPYLWLKSRPIYAYYVFEKTLQYPHQLSKILELWRRFEHWSDRMETSDVRGVC